MDDFQASVMGIWVNDDTCHSYRECRRNESRKGKIMDEFWMN